MSSGPPRDSSGSTPSARDLVPAGSELNLVATIAFTEGPAVDAEGNVFFSDIANSRIMKLSSGGELSVFRPDSGRSNGNMFDRDGRLLSCEGAEMGPGGRRRIVRTDMSTGEVTVLTDQYQGARYNSPNDLAIVATKFNSEPLQVPLPRC